MLSPNCDHPVFNDKGLYIAELCHIKSANKGGQRYDSQQTDIERCACENLLFMCHRHHKETDDEIEYNVEKLTQIKKHHELKFTEKGREASKEMIYQIQSEINYFWNRQSSKTFKIEDLKIKRNFNIDILELIVELEEHIEAIRNYCDLSTKSESSESIELDLKRLLEKVGLNILIFDENPYYENPLMNRNWELHNIGRPNLFSNVSLCLNQLKVKTVEELLKRNPEKESLKILLEKFRKEFEENYDDSYYVD